MKAFIHPARAHSILAFLAKCREKKTEHNREKRRGRKLWMEPRPTLITTPRKKEEIFRILTFLQTLVVRRWFVPSRNIHFSSHHQTSVLFTMRKMKYSFLSSFSSLSILYVFEIKTSPLRDEKVFSIFLFFPFHHCDSDSCHLRSSSSSSLRM